MSQASISVIIPSYNGEAFIAQAIQSIYRQSLAASEIIVVDDGSTDRTKEIVEQQDGNIFFIQQDHTGNPAAGRNRGINEASGEFIAFLDQDDLWPENKHELQYNKMFLPQKPDVVIGHSKIVNLSADINKLNLEKRYQKGFNFLLSAALFRKSVFDHVGLFDEHIKLFGSDTDWLLRAREKKVLFYFQKEVSLYWQRHHQNRLNDLPTWKQSVVELMKLSITRRLKAGKKNVIPLPSFQIIHEI